jgi:hypothetical protein
LVSFFHWACFSSSVSKTLGTQDKSLNITWCALPSLTTGSLESFLISILMWLPLPEVTFAASWSDPVSYFQCIQNFVARIGVLADIDVLLWTCFCSGICMLDPSATCEHLCHFGWWCYWLT